MKGKNDKGTTQLLLSLHQSGAKEDTPRLITTITPAREIYPRVQKDQVINSVMAAALEHERQLAFYNGGIKSVLRTEEELYDVIQALALFRFSLEQEYIADMYTGLYTMLTRGEKFVEKHPVYTVNEDGEKLLTAYRIITTIPTLYKAALGPLLDSNARSLNGTYDIVHDAKKHIDPIIYGKMPMPRATASLKNVPQPDGSKMDAWISGEPLHIHRATKGLSEFIAVDLDTDFAPVKIEGDKVTADDQFIHNIAGLTAMLQLGKRYTDDISGQGIKSSTAKNIILTIQTGIELSRITGMGVQKNKQGRINVTIRRNAIPGLVPGAMRDEGKPTQRINFKEVSNAIAKAGQYFYKAIEMTGIINELEDAPNPIYVPARERGAEFPDALPYKHIAYFKADPLREK